MADKSFTPQETELKEALARQLITLLDSSGMSQVEAAHRIGTTQPKISQIRRYQLKNVSVGRLLQALVSLEQQIDIVIKPARTRVRPSVTVGA